MRISDWSSDVCSSDLLDRDLALVRRHGYSRDNEELELGVRCIAAGIYDDTGKLLAGLSLSAPAERMRDEWISTLVSTAAHISEALGYEHGPSCASTPDDPAPFRPAALPGSRARSADRRFGKGGVSTFRSRGCPA